MSTPADPPAPPTSLSDPVPLGSDPQPDPVPLGSDPQPDPNVDPNAPADDPNAPADILDFEFDENKPSDFDDPEDDPNPTPEPAPQSADPDPEPNPDPQSDPQNDPNPEPDPADPPSNSDLREQVVAANERERVATARNEELQRQLDTIKAERDQFQGQIDSTNTALARQNAAFHPEVTAITAPWERDRAELQEELAASGGASHLLSLDGATDLITKWRGVGKEGDEGFEDRRQSFVNQLEEQFGDDRRDVAKLISRGARLSYEAEQKMNDIVSNGAEHALEDQRRAYGDMVKGFDALEENWGSAPVGLADTDPLHPRVLLDTLMEGNEALAARDKSNRALIRRTALPLPPLDPKELAGMTEQDQAAYLQDRNKRYEADRTMIVANSRDALLWQAVGPSLVKELREAQQRLESYTRSTPKPGDPSAHPDPNAEPEPEGEADPSEFEIEVPAAMM